MQVGNVLQVIWGQAGVGQAEVGNVLRVIQRQVEVGHVLSIILVQAGLYIVFTVPLQMYFHLFQFQNTVFFHIPNILFAKILKFKTKQLFLKEMKVFSFLTIYPTLIHCTGHFFLAYWSIPA